MDDPAVHPLAFDWDAAFPEVTASGGFDVVVGNPPYIRQEWLKPYKAHWEKRFKSFFGTADIYTYFFELGMNCLRLNGRLGFITSGSWVRGNFGGPLRGYLSENTKMESIIDFGEYQPFEGAEMIRPSISVFRKSKPKGSARLFKWLTKGNPPENLSDVISCTTTMSTSRLGNAAWELDPDDVVALRHKLSDKGQTLKIYAGRVYRGVVTGLNDVFVISSETRSRLIKADSASEELIVPFVQGTHMRPWYLERSNQFLIFTRRGVMIDQYPAIEEYLLEYRERLEPKPSNHPSGVRWLGRKPGQYKWFEIQDTVDYWQVFEGPKIVWSDISKLPRFCMDTSATYLGNTGFVVPGENHFLLGILSSWATWFFISKTAQPLRLRGDRWQYRLFAQFMEQVPIPYANNADQAVISDLSRRCGDFAQTRYEVQRSVQARLGGTFGESDDGLSKGQLNNKAQAWWENSLNQLGTALKTSFKLPGNPFQNPRIADEWEPYLAEKKAEVDRLTRQLQDAEAELNDRVYRLFDLTPDEIALLQREVEH